MFLDRSGGRFWGICCGTLPPVQKSPVSLHNGTNRHYLTNPLNRHGVGMNWGANNEPTAMDIYWTHEVGETTPGLETIQRWI